MTEFTFYFIFMCSFLNWSESLKTKYGLPVVSAESIFETLKQLGMANWEKAAESMPIDEYLKKNLSLEQIKEFKYLPQIEVAFFFDPGGKIFRGFRSSVEDHGVVIFTLLPDGLVPVTAEFRHGCEEIILDLPGGMVEKKENVADCAKREFEEESGIILKEIIRLSPVGTPLFARQFKLRNFSFVGIVDDPVRVQKQKLDNEEYLSIVLVPLNDWLRLIDMERVDSHSVVTTLMTLRYLKYV